MARLLSYLLATALLLPAGTAFAQKIAYVDVRRAVAEVEAGKAAFAKLKAKIEKGQKEIDAERNALRAKKEELDKKRLAMDEATVRAKEEELEREAIRLANLQARMQKELTEEENKTLEPILSRLEAVLAQIAQREGFDVVLRGELVAYGQPSLDITNELIRRFNEANKAGAKK